MCTSYYIPHVSLITLSSDLLIAGAEGIFDGTSIVSFFAGKREFLFSNFVLQECEFRRDPASGILLNTSFIVFLTLSNFQLEKNLYKRELTLHIVF